MDDEGRELQEQNAAQVETAPTRAAQTTVASVQNMSEPTPPPVASPAPASGAAPVGSTNSLSESFPPAPLHWLTSLAAMIIDGAFGIPETIAALSIIGLPLVPVLSIASGLACLAAVLFLQRYAAKDDWTTSFAKSLVIGLLSGLPLPFTGTVVGGLSLMWHGAYALWGSKTAS